MTVAGTTWLWNALTDARIGFCILRNYEAHPTGPWSGDVDLAVDTDSPLTFEHALRSIVERRDLCMVVQDRHDHGCRYLVFDSGLEFFLKLDVHWNEVWRGALWYSAREVTKRRVLKNGLYVPDPVDEAAISTLAGLLSGGQLKPSYVTKLSLTAARQQTELEHALASVLGDELARVLVARLIAQDGEGLREASSAVRSKLWRTSLLRAPSRQIRGVWKYLLYQARNRTRQQGFALRIGCTALSHPGFHELLDAMKDYAEARLPAFRVRILEDCRHPPGAYVIYKMLRAAEVLVLAERSIVAAPLRTQWSNAPHLALVSGDEVAWNGQVLTRDAFFHSYFLWVLLHWER